MDGAQEVERIRAARAMSANVHISVLRRVSFGEPPRKRTRSAQCHDCGDFLRRSNARIGLVRYSCVMNV
jgi:hypothetical protein